MAMQPAEWSVNALATELRMDRRTVAKRLADAGVQPSGRRAGSPVYALRDAIAAALELPAPDGAGLSLEAERARLSKEQADHQALKNAQLRGELLERDEVETTWARMVLAAKERLRSIPATARVRIAGFTQKQAVTLRDLIDEALSELADDGLPKRRMAGKDEESLAATAEAEALGVG